MIRHALCILLFLLCILAETSTAVGRDQIPVAASSTITLNELTLGLICISIAIVLVLVIFSCGGCDDMDGDVGTENHPACGKQSSSFSPIVADANTSVLMSSHTMGDNFNSSMIPPQNLPYSLHPGSAQGFTGYQTGYQTNEASAPQAQAPLLGNQRPVVEPPPPSYEQVRRQDSHPNYGF